MSSRKTKGGRGGLKVAAAAAAAAAAAGRSLAVIPPTTDATRFLCAVSGGGSLLLLPLLTIIPLLVRLPRPSAALPEPPQECPSALATMRLHLFSSRECWSQLYLGGEKIVLFHDLVTGMLPGSVFFLSTPYWCLPPPYGSRRQSPLWMFLVECYE